MMMQPHHAMIRFGLGRRRGEALPDDPATWLLRQLDGPDPLLARYFPGAEEALLAIYSDRVGPREKDAPTATHGLLLDQEARLADTLLTTQAPFRERLVWFWANHFTVSRRSVQAPLAPAYLHEAIRPHVTGRFVDMVMAVMTHPAMLLYLDNAGSVGPDSAAGKRGHRGLNENLARECLELHTVGTAAGYTQADVTAFAGVLTGWGVHQDPPVVGFAFHEEAHQPGAKLVMGQSFPPGMAGGIAALTWLADHPATHRRLATALVRHFVADDPPPPAVAIIEHVLRDTGGDLKAASEALVVLPAAWATPLGKLRDPQSYVVAALRAFDLPPERREETVPWMAQLGQGMFDAPLPNGWADTAPAWCDGEALLRRADWAWAVSGRAGDLDPNEVLQDSLGPLAAADTIDAVRRAGSRREALTLLLAGPEFQRR